MKLCIDTLEIRKRDFLLENHLVECSDEVGIEEAAVEDTETQASSNELEVVQMLRVNTRSRVDLQSVVVVCGVLEETVEGIEHLVGQKEEEFSDPSISMELLCPSLQ